MLKKHSISLVVAIVLITPLTVFALRHWIEKRWTALPVLNVIHTDFAFDLQNQQGKTVTAADWNGKIVVANFFFTHCPSICPKMTKNLKKVQTAVASRKELLLASFTVDPKRDTVQQLQAYANRFGIGGNWNLLTGSKPVIYELARKQFRVAATDGDGSEQDFIHSEKLILLDKKKRIRGYYNGTSETDVQQLITDIQKLDDEK